MAFLRSPSRCASTRRCGSSPRNIPRPAWAGHRATLSHGVAACATGRYVLALVEFAFVREHLDAVNAETLPIVFQQSAVAQRRLGAIDAAHLLAEYRAVELARNTPEQKHLGDALEIRGLLANQANDHDLAIAVLQEAFAAYKAVGRRVDCARTMNNLAQSYFSVRRFKAARRALNAADRLANELSADAIRARSRILLGEIEALEGNTKKASAHRHDAIEIARRTRARSCTSRRSFNYSNCRSSRAT